jgi:hypothetical protein
MVVRKSLTGSRLCPRNQVGMLLAFETTTPFLHDALLDVDLPHPGSGSLGSPIRTGTAQMAAPQLPPGIGCNPGDNRAVELRR